jgi:23S rRNA (adenine2503-C2)-methyltransferase
MAQLMFVCWEGGDKGTRETGFTDFDNIVVMGMGEPLMNYEATMRALTIANAPWGLGVGARRITISTSGVVPRIRELADEAMQFRLAISLHGATDEVRTQIMPVNRKYPLDTLLTACKDYFDSTSRRISFEYTLLYGQNDKLEDAARLASLLRKYFPGKTPVHINLIRLNPVKERSFETPDDSRAYAFCAELERLGMNATLRRRLGKDIDAACGQLRRKRETT